MTNIRKIVIGPNPNRPALVLKQSADLAQFEGGEDQDSNGALERVLTALQGLPDLLLAGYVGSTKLMEVQIHGDLVRASDGMGFRAFAMGDQGVAEQAKLFEPEHITALIDVAVVWRLASIVVGQKYLADISVTLKNIEKDVSAISQFQRDEQASKIESAYEYLRQAERALSHGERESAVRHRLEAIETDMDAIQRHLAKLFDVRLDTRIKNANLLDYSNIEQGFPEKLQDLQRLLHEHRLAGLTRVGALQILSAFPGEVGLKGARAQVIKEAADRNKSMCESLEMVMIYEVSEWSGRAESVLTNITEVALGQTKVHRWLDNLLLPKSHQSKAKPAVNLRSPTGSDTPRLDAIKLASAAMIRQLAATEMKRAANLEKACYSMNRLISGNLEPTRCLVEWGESGPVRIRQIANVECSTQRADAW